MKKYRIGYTQGVYDMFHVGHLNLINKAKEQCDYLIVGINSDELVMHYKNKMPVVCDNDRQSIVANIKAVNDCIVVSTLDKVELYKTIKFDAIFIGDDWKDNPRWQKTVIDLSMYGVDVVFLPYTKGVSSTYFRKVEQNRVAESGGLL